MGVQIYAVLLIVCATITPILSTYHVCAGKKHYDPCQLMERGDDYHCHTYYNQLDCLATINNYTTNFGAISADEALLANSFVSNVSIIAVISDGDTDYGKYETESMLMVLTKEKYTSFEGLRGKRMCHPGYGKLKLPRYYLNKFDETVLHSLYPNICLEKLDTIIEKRYFGLSQIFGDSCYPGPWVDDTSVDDELKNDYPRLCKLCATTETDKCSIQRISDPFKQALDCFKRNGDIVLTTYEEYSKNNASLGDYYQLCPNGQTILKTAEPCYWGKRSKPLLVADRKNQFDIQTELIWNMFGDKIYPIHRKQLEKIDVKPYLEQILFTERNQQLLSNNKTLNNFLKEIDEEAKPHRCDQPIRWCTTSDMEFEKCRWFRQATINQGITPTVNCVQATSQLHCLYKVNIGEADITNTLNNYGYVARKHGLQTIAYPETSKKDLTKSMVIVKDTYKFKSFKDLKKSFGCFAEFGDIAFMSLIKHLQNIKLVDKDCDYGLMVSEFVGDSCAPGVNDDYHGRTNKTDIKKLCHCAGTKSSTECGVDAENEYFGNEGALKCLSEIGSFAAITTRDINLQNSSYANYTVLCKNGTLAQFKGLDVDNNCFLTISTNTELVIKRDNPNIKNIKIALTAFEEQFGRQTEKAFQLFNIFNGTKDLLFKDSTPGLSFDTNNEFVNNYVQIFVGYDQCVEDNNNGALTLNGLFNVIITASIFAVLSNL